MPIIHGAPQLTCPKCGNDDEFQVMAMIPAQLSCKSGGIEHIFQESGIGLSPESACVCMECKYDGPVSVFAGVEAMGIQDGFIVEGQEGNA